MRSRVILCSILLVACLAISSDALACPTCKDGLAAADSEGANIARGYFYNTCNSKFSVIILIIISFQIIDQLFLKLDMDNDGRVAFDDLLSLFQSGRTFSNSPTSPAPASPIAGSDSSSSDNDDVEKLVSRFFCFCRNTQLRK